MNATLEASSKPVEKKRDASLISCISQKDQMVVGLLLKIGANPDHFDDEQWTPLKYAIAHDKEWAAKLLLKHGVNPNFYDKAKWTPLTCAIWFDKAWAIRLLLSNGADPNFWDGDYTPLKYAIKHNKKLAAKLLLEHSANPNLCDGEHWTPFIYSISHNKEWAVKLLLQYGANPNLYDQLDWTPLTFAIEKDKKWAVKLLLVAGADPNLSNQDGYSPLRCSILCDMEWAVRLLLEYGADPISNNLLLGTPFSYAIYCNKEWAIKLFLKYNKCLASPYNVSGYTFGDYFPVWEKIWQKLGDDIEGGRERHLATLLKLRLNGQHTLKEGWKGNRLNRVGIGEVEKKLYNSFNHFLNITISPHKALFRPINYASFVDDSETNVRDETQPYLLSVSIKLNENRRHVVSIGFWKDFVVFGDRAIWGNNVKDYTRKVLGVEINRLKEKSLSREILGLVKTLKDVEDWKKLVRNYDILIEEESLEMPSQWSNSCSLASPKATIYGLLFLQAKEHGASRKCAHAFYKQWAFWDRQNMLKKYIVLNRVRTVLSWGLGEKSVEKLQKKLAETYSPKEVLKVLAQLVKKLQTVPSSIFLEATNEAFENGLFGLCQNVDKAHENISRIVDSIPLMIKSLHDYYNREANEGHLAELRWASNEETSSSHQLK